MINNETGEVFDIIKQNEDGDYVLAKQAYDMICNFELTMKQVKAQYDEYKAALREAMEQNGIEKIKTDAFTVSYVPQTERVSLDAKKVEQKYPEVYTDCVRVSDVKANVRVRMK